MDISTKPCVPCGFSLVSLVVKTSSYFFYHKVHKDLHKVHKAGWVFSLVSLLIKFLAIFLTTKFTRIYTKFTKLDGYYPQSLASLVVFLCVPCGKTSRYFFLTTKFTRIYTKFTKLDGYFKQSLVSLVAFPLCPLW